MEIKKPPFEFIEPPLMPMHFSRFKTLMQTYLNENLKDLNISSIHIMYLALLTKVKKLKQSEFTKRLGYNKANSSRVLAELENKCYIKKDDGNFYVLTAEGSKVSERIIELLKKWKNSLFAGIEKQDLEVFERVMLTVVENSKKKLEQLKEDIKQND